MYKIIFLLFLPLSLLAQNLPVGTYILTDTLNINNSIKLELSNNGESSIFFTNDRDSIFKEGKWVTTGDTVMLTFPDSVEKSSDYSLRLRNTMDGKLSFLSYEGKSAFSIPVNSVFFIDDFYTYVYAQPVNSWDLPDQGYEAFNQIFDNWFRNVYRECLSSENIDLNCGDCVYAYADVIFTINKYGRIIDCKFEKENICSRPLSPQMKNCFLDYFMNYLYPLPLRGRVIRAKLGTGLKC